MTRCRPARHVAWAVETKGVFVLDRATGTATFLSYPEAAIWDLAVRGETGDLIAGELSLIASLQPEESRKLVAETLERFRSEGFLVEEESHG